MSRSLATARDDNLFLPFRGVLSEAKDAEESHEGIPRFARDDKKEGVGATKRRARGGSLFYLSWSECEASHKKAPQSVV